MKYYTLFRVVSITLLLTHFAAHTSETVHQNYFIREAQESDREAIATFTKTIAGQDFKPIVMNLKSDWEFPQYKEKNVDEHLVIWAEMQDNLCGEIFDNSNVARQEGRLLLAIESIEENKEREKIVGVSMAWWRSKPEKDLFIRFIAVDQSRRRQGVGSALLNETVRKFDEVKECSLYTYAFDNKVALNFFEKHGFVAPESELYTLYAAFPRSNYFLQKKVQDDDAQ